MCTSENRDTSFVPKRRARIKLVEAPARKAPRLNVHGLDADRSGGQSVRLRRSERRSRQTRPNDLLLSRSVERDLQKHVVANQVVFLAFDDDSEVAAID
jgi:hypothetical protein